jgi:hypothetical protein
MAIREAQMVEQEFEAGFSLKARADRVLWVSCKSEEIAKFKIGGRQSFERFRPSKGRPWLILIRDGEPVAKAFSKSRNSPLSENKRVSHQPHNHATEEFLDDEAEVQLYGVPYSYDIDLAKFMQYGFYELCNREKNTFLEMLVARIQKIQSRKDWLNSGN